MQLSLTAVMMKDLLKSTLSLANQYLIRICRKTKLAWHLMNPF